jgi:hypothetical protein
MNQNVLYPVVRDLQPMLPDATSSSCLHIGNKLDTLVARGFYNYAAGVANMGHHYQNDKNSQ